MSINNDIRVRSNNTGKVAGLILAIATLSLLVAFAVSFIPSSANAAGLPSWLHSHSWSHWNPHHNFNHDNNYDDADDVLYTQCHNHLDDNAGNGVDLKDPACVHVENEAPAIAYASLVTDVNVPVNTALVVTDADDDLVYFTVAAPAHGTVSGVTANTAYTLDALPTLTYTPAPGYTGSDIITIEVSDGLLTDSVGIDVTVNPVVVVPPPAACSVVPTSGFDVDVTQQITNDPDSGLFGNWALDTFTRHIQVWHDGATLCAQSQDSGTFVTTGPNSPQTNVALTAGIPGTMTGGSGIVVVTGGTLGDVGHWGTTGTIASPDCSVAGTCDGLTGKWMANYFPTGTITYPNWGWTYNACGHGTWTNAAAGNNGNILSAGVSCVVSNSAQTIVVHAEDLAADLSAVAGDVTKWFFYNDETGSVDGAEGINNTLGSFVAGPSTAPIGIGSAQISVPNEGLLAHNARRDIATYQFKSIKLANITSLSFSTYSQSAGNGGSVNRAPYLNFNVSFDGLDTWQKRLAFVPNLNGTVTPDTWQTWNAAASNGVWVYSGAFWPAGVTTVANTVTGMTARTLSSLLSDYPNIQTRASDSWFGFRVGEPYADGFTGNVDNFIMGVNDNGTVTTKTFDFEPTDPTCAANQHIDNHVCVANPSNGGGNGGNGGGNGGGGAPISGPLSVGFVNTGSTGGQVLGASTELPLSCSAYLTSYLKKGSVGDAVKKLQTFLNKNLGLNIPVTGTFGPLTFDAVAKFQTKYADEILKPWFDKNLASDMTPSGYAYKMTIYKINLLECASLNTPAPQLP